MNSQDNYPNGYREEHPNHFPMPEEPDTEDKRLALYEEYATPEQSFEAFCDSMFETLGDAWVHKLSRRTK